jgi:hypothetical protein
LVVLPDGTPGMVPAEATNVFGERPEPQAGTVLSVEGVRQMRRLVLANPAVDSAPARQASGKPWKVVRHETGIDPFHRLVWLYSSHVSEQAARKARDRAKAAAVRSAGHEMAARWSWSVVNDPAGSLVNAGEGEPS